MPTVHSELDRVAPDVLAVLAETRPPRNYAAAAPTLFQRFAIKVNPDNLRAWHVRRVAVDLSDRTPTDLRCDIDDYAEAVRLWRKEGRTWASISRLLSEGFQFTASEERLRGWWHRRKARADKMDASSAAVAQGVSLIAAIRLWREEGRTWASISRLLSEGFQFTASEERLREWWHRGVSLMADTGQGAESAPPGPSPAAATPVAGQAPDTGAPAAHTVQLAPAGRALPGETDTQRRIREKRMQQATDTGVQDAMLDRLAASAAANSEGVAP